MVIFTALRKEWSDINQLSDYLSKFSDPYLAEFVRYIWDDDNPQFDEERRATAMAATDVMIKYLTDRKMYNPIMPNKQVDACLAGCLLHNVLFDRAPKNWIDVFKLRKKYATIGDQILDGHQDDAINYVFQIVEAQMGELMPVYACRPVNGQVTYIVWEVLWFFYHRDLLSCIN